MKKLVIISIIISFWGCTPQYDLEEWRCDCKGFESEIAEFIDYAPGWVNWIPTKIQKTGPIYLDDGIRRAGTANHREGLILVDTTSWRYKLDKDVLIWHELGHLLLHREHGTETMMLDGREVPKSIMNNTEHIYLLDYMPAYYKDYYLTELFTN